MSSIGTEKTRLVFWGSQAFAMMPFGLYILISGIFSVGLHYYSMKGLIFAAVISLLAGFFLCRNKGKYWDSIVHGLAQYGNSRLIFIFLIIGIFSKLMMTGKIGDGFIWLSLQLGITKSGFVVFAFLASAIISMGAEPQLSAYGDAVSDFHLFLLLPDLNCDLYLLGGFGSRQRMPEQNRKKSERPDIDRTADREPVTENVT